MDKSSESSIFSIDLTAFERNESSRKIHITADQANTNWAKILTLRKKQSDDLFWQLMEHVQKEIIEAS